MAHEKNIAALLREDAKTIHIQFATGAQDSYTYVCSFDVMVGDAVLVEANQRMQVVQVVEVDDCVKIEPGSDIYYKWVIMKVDLAEHLANIKRNNEIEELVRDAYQKNLRRSFAAQLLSGIDDATSRNHLQQLLGK